MNTSGSGSDKKRVRPPFERLKGRHDVLGSSYLRYDDFKPERTRGCLSVSHLQHGGRSIGIDHDS